LIETFSRFLEDHMGSAVAQIPGLQYYPEYITPQEHDQLLAIIDQQPWLTTLKRRVQQYGYRYDYKSRAADASTFLGALPAWVAPFTERLQREGLVAQTLNQLIVNEYEPGQGISAHIDSVPAFGDTVLSLTLGSPCVMLFRNGETEVPILTEPRGLLIMQGEARYTWKHSIPGRKKDTYQGQIIERKRRVSLTFRNVLDAQPS
jgi:alkylated DNA repair dioxygenase AlkB